MSCTFILKLQKKESRAHSLFTEVWTCWKSLSISLLLLCFNYKQEECAITHHTVLPVVHGIAAPSQLPQGLCTSVYPVVLGTWVCYVPFFSVSPLKQQALTFHFLKQASFSTEFVFFRKNFVDLALEECTCFNPVLLAEVRGFVNQLQHIRITHVSSFSHK